MYPAYCHCPSITVLTPLRPDRFNVIMIDQIDTGDLGWRLIRCTPKNCTRSMHSPVNSRRISGRRSSLLSLCHCTCTIVEKKNRQPNTSSPRLRIDSIKICFCNPFDNLTFALRSCVPQIIADLRELN